MIAQKNTMIRERISPIIAICCVGLIAEFFLPWAVIWLSDAFFIDIPGWLPWVLFGGPPALSLAAVLIYWALRTWLKRPSRARESFRTARAIARFSWSTGRPRLP
jgi:O-antigen/teichoic acid export membrane protein